VKETRMSWYYGWRPYVSVHERRRKAERAMSALRKKGVDVQPVTLSGRTIASTFWGKAWCDHLENFSDFANRLPRGRTYVRNGSVCHLEIHKGLIEARVSGSEVYTVRVEIKPIARQKWQKIKARSAGQISSLLDLLAGRLSAGVMQVVTDAKEGLFPLPGEMSFSCSCPDWAVMCKHVAAVLYGVGARLDTQPELLFLLRGVDHEELISAPAEQAVVEATTRGKAKRVQAEDLGAVFGIDLQPAARVAGAAPRTRQPTTPPPAQRPVRTARKAKTMARAGDEQESQTATAGPLPTGEPAEGPLLSVPKGNTKRPASTRRAPRRSAQGPSE